MVNITNPHNEIVNIVIDGVEYSINPGQTIEVSREIADKWVLVHQFLSVKDGSAKPQASEVIAATPAPVTEAEVKTAIPELKESVDNSRSKKATK